MQTTVNKEDGFDNFPVILFISDVLPIAFLHVMAVLRLGNADAAGQRLYTPAAC